MLPTSAFAEGRVEISQATFPLSISEPGSYVVTENLSGSTGQNGITITADDVSIDLNGFTLDGVTTNSLDGIRVNGDRRNLSVRNGILKNWGDDGVDATNAINGRFEGLIVYRNSNAGLQAGFNTVIERCIAHQNGTILNPPAPSNSNFKGDGFRVENGSTLAMLLSVNNSHHAIRSHSGSTVRNTIMKDNGHDGFHGSHATLVEGCVAAENSEGIEVDSGSRVFNSVAFFNAEDGIRNKALDPMIMGDIAGGGVFSGNVTVSNRSNNIDIRGPGTIVEGCVSFASGDHGIRVSSRSTARANLSSEANNKDNFRVGSDGSGSRVEGNHSVEGAADESIQVDGSSSGNFIVRNSASGDDGIVLGVTDHGVTVDPAGGLPANNAWANFQYNP